MPMDGKLGSPKQLLRNMLGVVVSAEHASAHGKVRLIGLPHYFFLIYIIFH
jgi:hypothetical protein